MVLRRDVSAEGGIELAPDHFSWRHVPRALMALLLIVVLMAIVARASEAIGPSGEGASNTSGYVVSEIEYSLLASAPTRVDGVTFNMTAGDGMGVPGRVTVSVDGAHWITCLPAGGSRLTCPLQASVRELTSVRVIAVQ